MGKVRIVLLLLGVGVVSAVGLAPTGTAQVTPALPSASSRLLCPSPGASAPLAGAWVGRLSSDDANLVQVFRFVPVSDACERFVVNAEAVTRPASVSTTWPEVTGLTGFMGMAAPSGRADGMVDFTAMGYGVQRTADREGVVFIAVMSGTIALPEECKACQRGHHDDCEYDCGRSEGSTHSDDDCDGEYGRQGDDCGCLEPPALAAEVTVAYYEAAQDTDGDGFPDEGAAAVETVYDAELRRVELRAPCQPSASFVALLTTCDTAAEPNAVGRAIFKRTQQEGKISFVVTAQNITDPNAVKLLVGETPDAQAAEVLVLCPQGSDDRSRGEGSRLLCCGSFLAKDLAGPLKGKTVADVIQAFREGRASVVITTTENPEGELCGSVEDPNRGIDS